MAAARGAEAAVGLAPVHAAADGEDRMGPCHGSLADALGDLACGLKRRSERDEGGHG
jgi:hypothetical protein